MDLQLKGKVVEILEEQSGESSNGPWRKQDFILETGGNYPKKVCITVWGDNIDAFSIEKGEQITAYIDIQSREYKGRWYTDVKAWKVEKEKTSGSSTPSSENVEPFDPMDISGDADDELPF